MRTYEYADNIAVHCLFNYRPCTRFLRFAGSLLLFTDCTQAHETCFVAQSTTSVVQIMVMTSTLDFFQKLTCLLHLWKQDALPITKTPSVSFVQLQHQRYTILNRNPFKTFCGCLARLQTNVSSSSRRIMSCVARSSCIESSHICCNKVYF